MFAELSSPASHDGSEGGVGKVSGDDSEKLSLWDSPRLKCFWMEYSQLLMIPLINMAVFSYLGNVIYAVCHREGSGVKYPNVAHFSIIVDEIVLLSSCPNLWSLSRSVCSYLQSGFQKLSAGDDVCDLSLIQPESDSRASECGVQGDHCNKQTRARVNNQKTTHKTEERTFN